MVALSAVASAKEDTQNPAYRLMVIFYIIDQEPNNQFVVLKTTLRKNLQLVIALIRSIQHNS